MIINRWVEEFCECFRESGLLGALTLEDVRRAVEESPYLAAEIAAANDKVPKQNLDIGVLSAVRANFLYLDRKRDDWESYTLILQNFSEISRGAFIPSNVQEDNREGGTINLSFEHQGRKWVTTIPNDDRLHLTFVPSVNKAVFDSGGQFSGTFEDGAFVVFLAQKQYEHLVALRGWELDSDTFGANWGRPKKSRDTDAKD